jgi:chromosome segregation ATPase
MDSRNSLEIKIQDLAEELRNYEQKLQYLKGIEYDIYTELEALEQDHPQYNQKLQNLQAVRSEINKYDVTKRREQFEDDVAELKRRREYSIIKII